jgi:Flp pilus assembly protein TadD
MINLGQLAMQDGQTDEGLALFHEALATQPKLDIARFNIAIAAYVRRDFDTALAELAVVEKSPLFAADAMVLEARILQARTGKPQFNLLGNAASIAGRNWSVSQMYPLTLAANGRAAKAYDDILRQLTGHPYRAEAWRLLGQIAEQIGDKKIAARAYGEAADRDVRDEVSRAKLLELRNGL